MVNGVIMKMKYIKPVILCCYDIDMSIMTASQLDASIGQTGDSDAKTNKVETAGSGEEGGRSARGEAGSLWCDNGTHHRKKMRNEP